MRGLTAVAGVVAALVAGSGLSGIAPAAAADGCPSGGPCVVVSVQDGSVPTTVVSRDTIASGGLTATYGFRSTAGGGTIDDTVTGLSVPRLIEDDAGVPTGAVAFAEVTVGSSPTMTLSSAELGDPSAAGYPFPSGLPPIVYVAGSDALGYVRPVHDDDQPNDFAQTSAGGRIDLVLHLTGSLLHPSISAPSTSVHAQAPVTITASVPDADPASLSWSWSFGDGSTATSAASATHAFAQQGTYDVRLTVRSADGSLGVSAPLRFTVGRPTPTDGGTGGSSPTHTPTPAPTIGPTDGDGHAVGGSPTSGSTSAASPQGDGSSTRGPTPAPTSTGASDPTPSPSDSATSAPVADGLVPVSGTVISRASVQTPVDDGAAAGSAPAADAPTSATVSAGAIGVGGLVLLLALGALLESGALRRRRITTGGRR